MSACFEELILAGCALIERASQWTVELPTFHSAGLTELANRDF
jgi:hypothetical protein